MPASDRVPRQVFVSPHPDDAVWSCGGRLAALVMAGVDVLLVSCFDGDAEGDSPLPEAGWRSMLRPSLRRLEDRQVALTLGVGHASMGLIDAGLRRSDGEWRYLSSQALMGPSHPDDRSIVSSLAAALCCHLLSSDHLHIPLAATSHVDHRIARQAAEAAAAALKLRALSYYEEFPYSIAPGAGGPPGTGGLFPRSIAVDLAVWLHLGSRYRSQVRLIFGQANRFKAALTRWAEERGNDTGTKHGERYWSRSDLR